MPISSTSISGLFRIEWDCIEDTRGFFKHSYQSSELATVLGREPRLRQGNHSRSWKSVLRGFHLENWDKLIYVPRGTALCVVADARPLSETFGLSEAFLLGDPPGRYARLYISSGLANAFYCFTEVDYLNDVSEEFDPTNRRGIIWNDPTLAVKWPCDAPLLSKQDSCLPSLRELFPSHPIFVV